MVVHASQPPPVHHYNYRCLVKSAAPEPRIAAASGGNSSTQGSQPGTMRGTGGGGDAFFRFASDAFFRAYDGFSSAPTATADVGRLLLGAWEQVRSGLVVPLLRAAVVACMVMSVIVLAEKVFLGTVSLAVKLLRRRPERLYRCDPIAPQDKEAGSAAFPMVLVQIPMYNEKEVYQLSIGAACRLTWPADRLLVQVLDDSTEAIIKELVKSECEKWAKEGINIRYETRKDRAGYKAGNLREGMKHGYVRDCEFVAMFDADFQPAPDFLVKTIPFLVNNPRLALVQTRWKFVNANDCFLTRMQEMSMDYHFKVEQEAGSSLFNFFGYNGTAGVWRTQAIVEPGGWEDRTTAEDMDLAYRAGLLGWEFLYVGSIKVKSELPSTLKAYRSQQHRWSCGPAVLLKKMFWEILSAKKVSALKKFYMIFNFFIARRTLLYLYTFLFFSMLLPMNIIFPEVQIPTWQLVYVPAANTLLNSVGTPRSIHLIVIWFLFENVMALHRLKATLIGIFEAGRANEWIVTQKLGNAQKLKSIANGSGNCHFKNRFHRLEIFIGLFLLLAACYDYLCRADYFYFFVLPQSIMYFAVGFQFIGLNISN